MEGKRSKNMTRFTHDCDKCVSLGTFHQYDLYWCVNSNNRKLDSILARFGDEPHEYKSHHPPGCFSGPPQAREWYQTALKRAEEKGLYDPKTQGWSQDRGCCECEHTWTESYPYGIVGVYREVCPRCGSSRTFINKKWDFEEEA